MSFELHQVNTQQKHASFDVKKKVDQMRLVALQTGELRHVNDEFARVLGRSVEDLKGCNLLDLVLFKSPENLENICSFSDDSNAEVPNFNGLNALQSGSHILLLGSNRDPYNFFFDWVESHDGKRYLIASSFKDDRPTEWTHYREEQGQTDETVQKKNQDADKPNIPSIVDYFRFNNANDDVGLVKTITGPAVIGSTHLDDDDQSVFSKLNKDLKCVLSVDGLLLRADDHFLRKVNLKIGDHILDGVQEDSRALFRQLLQSLQPLDQYENAANDEDNSISFHAAMASPDKKKSLWVEWTISHTDRQLYCMGHDITDAKLNQKSLQSREAQLSEAQALANMGHWKWTVGTIDLDWSDQIYKIFGVDPENFSPTLDNANQLVHRRDIGHMMQAFQRAIIEQNDYDIDFRIIRPDETIAYVRCEGRCEIDSDGDVIALYGVMQDITEQTEYEMQLRQAKESAEQAYASKSRFLANMSHELRTPLNAIIGFSDMISQEMMGPIGSKKYLEYSNSINDSGKHLLDLITDILDMSKIEAGKYELDLEKVKLGDIMTSAIDMIKCRAKEVGITMHNNIEGSGPEIIADRRAIVQIALNILSNAVKFTLKNGSITVCIKEFDNHVTIKVQDTGIGIPANKLSAVLLPFEQVSTELTRGHEGSGLGLSITKELAELHGGMLSLESTENVGTVASIRLPRKAVIAIAA